MENDPQKPIQRIFRALLQKGGEMAKLIKPDGSVKIVRPANGREFTLQELSGYVGGYIELVRTISGRVMFVNEDGKRLQLAPNQKATDVAGLNGYDTVVGNAIICEDGEVS